MIHMEKGNDSSEKSERVKEEKRNIRVGGGKEWCVVCFVVADLREEFGRGGEKYLCLSICLQSLAIYLAIDLCSYLFRNVCVRMCV
jgi:hypothetical protein